MIPKIIHYCWFGNGEFSELERKCINSWKKTMPDFEIIEWNEKNFDINTCQYVKEAYENKKYAFVSDYVRLFVLKKYGGIYLDTDVEIIKNLDDFLKYNAVFGFEAANRVASAVLFSSKDNSLISKWLKTYDNRPFIKDGKMDLTPNVVKLTEILKEYGFSMNGVMQDNQELNVLLCEKNVFCPYSIGDKKESYNLSYTVHWCEGSWVEGNIRVKHRLVILLKKILGTKLYTCLRDVLSK